MTPGVSDQLCMEYINCRSQVTTENHKVGGSRAAKQKKRLRTRLIIPSGGILDAQTEFGIQNQSRFDETHQRKVPVVVCDFLNALNTAKFPTASGARSF